MNSLFSPSPRGGFGRGGFTLVEVVLAIGIVAIGFVSLMALLPTGLGLFRQAMDASIGSQISQQVVSEAQQADFDSLVPLEGTGGAGKQFFQLPLRYFDDQGTELMPATGSTDITSTQKRSVLYVVRTRGSMPGAADPNNQATNCFTTVPSDSRYGLRETTYLSVQVVLNPGVSRKIDDAVDPNSYLITPTLAHQKHFQVQTFSAVVARNGFHKASTTSP